MNKQAHNPELQLAWDFVEKTDRSIYLTGKAGTGKTTFLHKIKAESRKRLIVVAPTGVAAINAQGVTIHSFFQLPFGPIIPGAPQVQQRGNFKMRFGRKKIDIIRSLDLLIIDEISMVRADLLDGIDQVLRRYKNRDKVFGGVQVLMIGDLQQLAPVVKPNDWSLLSPYYETVFFFSSHVYQQANAIAIELQHIYRQDNQEFISLLNEVRNNKLSSASANELNKRYMPNFVPAENEAYITLTTHNNRAQRMNDVELAKLTGQVYTFEAEIKGKFNEHAYPTDINLALKKGAQVMFIKNDSSTEKRYFNGKMGEIISINSDEVIVECHEDGETITVTPETWENIKYSINQESQQIEEDRVGSFAQIPLRLAWAITIHKSQGLTFDKVIIDAEASFAHGQTYVALSRCRSIDGIVLKSQITSNSIITDTSVMSYIDEINNQPLTHEQLVSSQKAYQLNLLADLFDYSALSYPLKRCISLYYQNRNSLQGNVIEPLSAMLDFGVNHLLGVNASFHKQLLALSQAITLPEEDDKIQTRIKKGIEYFLDKTDVLINKQLNEFSFSTENKDIKKQFDKQLEIFTEAIEHKIYCFNGLKDGFSSELYLKLRAQAALQNIKEPKSKKEYDDTTEHPELFNTLKEYRMSVAKAEDKLAFQIFSQQTLYEMCRYFPISDQHLKNIHGMGKIRIEKYGKAIATIINDYVEINNITIPDIIVKKKKTSQQKGASQKQSLELFDKGMTVAEIAKNRSLVESTIEGHLASYIPTGEINITQLIPEQKCKELEKAMQGLEYEGLGDLKTQLENEYSYGELKIMEIYLKFEKSKKP